MPPPDNLLPTEWVTEAIIRQIFNDGQYYEKVLSSEWSTHVKEKADKIPRKLPDTEPAGTRSQVVYYYDEEGKLRAVVHQYLRPDGSLGEAGRPDPKRLILDDKTIAVRMSKKDANK
jgi:hypothetical protein